MSRNRRMALVTALALTILSIPGRDQQAPSGRIRDGLVTAYPLQEGSGRSAAGSGPVQAPMQLLGGLTWLEGRNGVSFPGTSEPFGRPASLLVEPAASLIDPLAASGAFTFEIWFKPSDNARVLRAGFAGLTDTSARAFSLESGGDSTRVYLSGSLAILAPRTASDAVEHLAVTYDRSTITLFRNGARVISEPATADISTWDRALPLMIGSVPGASPWRGQVYQAALYSRALTSAEIVQNAQAGSSPIPLVSEVRGRVVDPFGGPVSGANIVVEWNPSQGVVARTTTSADGSFLLRLAEGAYRLCVTRANVAVCARPFQTSGAAPLDLGAIEIGVDTLDLDGDGLSDDLERTGWKILVDEYGTGELAERLVTSDPAEIDTDRDGLTDRTEFAMKTDPRARDTDGDLLADRSELDQYKSNPLSVDTDRDARGPTGDRQPNPALFDGIEVSRSGTSPTLADTDGDGLTDYEEILGGGFNPLRANLPQWTLEPVGNPSITLNVTTKTSTGKTAVTSRLQRDQASQSQTDSTATRQTVENTQTIAAEAEAGCCPLGGSVKVSASAEFKQGLVNESAASFTRDSVRESQKTFQDELQEVNEQEYRDGELQVAMRFRNTSELSFKMKDLSVVAFRLAPQASGSFSVVSVLRPETPITNGVVLGPGSDHLFVAKATGVNALEISRLMRNPTSLFFEVGGFSVFQTDLKGDEVKDYAVVAQSVVERCALVVIDYEDGRVERHFVATNVQRNPDGSNRGVTMGDALRRIIGLDVRTSGKANGAEVLTRIRDRAQFGSAAPNTPKGYWTVMGSGRDFEPDYTTTPPTQSRKNFSDLVLRAGDRVSLVYVSDTDGDGLSLREERIFGSDPSLRDSDGDGLTDHFETKTGWTVNLFAENGLAVRDLARKVFPDPRFIDADRDGLTDSEEQVKGTDPNNADTDGDKIPDRDDPNPVQAPGGINLPRSGLLSHYRFDPTLEDLNGGLVRDSVSNRDLTATSDRFSKGYSGETFSLNNPRTGLHDFGDRHTNAQRRAIYFSQKGNTDERFAVAEGRVEVIPFNKSFTIAAWINPDKPSAPTVGEDGFGGVIMEQEGWASLFIEKRDNSGSAAHFGVAAGAAPAILSDCGTDGKTCFEPRSGVWTFYAAVLDSGRMSLYRDGTLVAGPVQVTAQAKADFVSKPFFRIGASGRNTVPTRNNCQFTARNGEFKLCLPGFQGAFDDFRVFERALRADEIRELYVENGFRR